MAEEEKEEDNEDAHEAAAVAETSEEEAPREREGTMTAMEEAINPSQGPGETGVASTGAEIDTETFNELRLPEEQWQGAQTAWTLLINSGSSREAIAEAIYGALFDSAPSLQVLFISPRAVQAMRFFAGINTMITSLHNPPELKSHVETLGFGHLDKDVTVPRAVLFRDAIVDLFVVELGSKFTSASASGTVALLNYVAGSLIYIRATYADRLAVLKESWAIANDDKGNNDKFATLGSQEGDAAAKHKAAADREGSKPEGAGAEGAGAAAASTNAKQDSMMQNVPTTFREMFQFNAAVMGFGQSTWMNEVLAQFDNIVTNVANSGRLQEECCVLVLRIAKVTNAKVNLAEFKSCMLASLRSLLPKDWTTNHEVSWSWLWENVEKLLMTTMGKTQGWGKSVKDLIESIDDATGYSMREEIYAKFFAACPAGESFFKQSNTYLHIVAVKIIQMTVEMYQEPIRMVDDISGLGLRHVGYAIPTELFGPFVSVCVEVVKGLGATESAVDGFRWSLALVAKGLTRTILEGSTIVMKAINVNTEASLNKAVGCAPRGERANWMLIIVVGTQDISPFLWSIQSGALNAASAMLKDLLTIRADRDKYYYGAEDLFKRHNDVVKVLLDDAPVMLPHLLDGLVWRSRVTVNGHRRVNYYLKDLLCGSDGSFAKTLEWIAYARDAKVVCHPVLVLLADLVWKNVACSAFLYRKSWFLVTLTIFICSQSVFKSLLETDSSDGLRYATFGLRCFIYIFAMGQMIQSHSRKWVLAFRHGDTVKAFGLVNVPSYLGNWQECANLVLMVCQLVMLATEPILHCLNDDGGVLFTADCEASKEIKVFPYSVFTMIAMMLYYVLLIDLAVVNNRVSAYALVCGRMLAELALFLIAEAIVLVTLSSAFACVQQKEPEFRSIPLALLALWEMALSMFSTADYQRLHNEPIILVGCWAYLLLSVIFLLNLLIAQLSCAYDAIYADMVGYARLKRIRVITENMVAVAPKRWQKFTSYLHLDTRIEFNEGDVGLAGGIQVQEVSSANPTTIDAIRRFGGSTSPSNPWPEEEGVVDDDQEKFQRLEDLVKKASELLLQNINKKKHKNKSGTSGSKGANEDSEGNSGIISGASGGGSGMEESAASEEAEGEEDE